MEFITQIIIIAITGIIIENTIFSRALGTSTLILISRSRKNIFGFGACVVYFTVSTSIICYFADKKLNESDISYIYKPLVYVLILGLIYIITLLCLWKLFYKTFGRMRKYVHISAFNCAVFGSMFLNSKYCITLPQYIGHGLGIGIGFVLAVYFVAVVFDKLYSENVPYSFRGYPLLLIYLGILGMAFYGLIGHELTF